MSDSSSQKRDTKASAKIPRLPGQLQYSLPDSLVTTVNLADWEFPYNYSDLLRTRRAYDEEIVLLVVLMVLSQRDCLRFRFLVSVFYGDALPEEEPQMTLGCAHHSSDAGIHICLPVLFAIIL
ncbi:hypothetical protein ARMGADRAFT_1090517 [Armillaria gallica]|uniref:Uncharacterized protein n=1 Tax=Armillaria gallica TaxID=47427 RepID=A0A2H3CLR3_ARMGA|nr:hypothetical protein ARMGADRAFT_1090517 [Armillaria gallica]